jgi:hypothetical protein
MFFKRFFRILAMLFILCQLTLIPANAAEENDPAIDDIVITTSSTDLLLFATVKNSFTMEMMEGVRNGIPITFRFTIVLDKMRSAWFDQNIAEKTVNHTLRYDAVKQTFQVTFSEKNKPKSTKSAATAKQLMAELNGITIAALKDLIPDAPYALQIKATLVENTLPLGIHYVLPFTSLWNFETDWRTIEFRY